MGQEAEWSQAELTHEFPDFDSVRVLGRGGFATVYEARHPRLGLVALKVLSGNTEWRLDSETRQRHWEQVRTETQAIGSLSAEPNIVTLHTSGVSTSGWPYLVMELCPGGSLADVLRRRARERGDPFEPGMAVEVGSAVSRALAAAHADGILHLDVKPANVLISRFGVYKLSDFGIARILSDGPAGGEDMFLTPHYAAPELWDPRPRLGSEADIYALGATLYQLLTLRRPFEGSSPIELARRVHDDLPEPLPRETTPARLVDVIDACLSKDPAARPDAPTLLHELRHLEQDSDATRTVHVAASPAPPAERRAESAVGSDDDRTRVRDRPRTEPSAPEKGDGGSRRTRLLVTAGLSGVVVVGLALVAAAFLRSGAPEEVVTDEELRAGQGLVSFDSPHRGLVSDVAEFGELQPISRQQATLRWDVGALDAPGSTGAPADADVEHVVLVAKFGPGPDRDPSPPVEQGLLAADGAIVSGERPVGRWSGVTGEIEVDIDPGAYVCFKLVTVTRQNASPRPGQLCTPTQAPSAPTEVDWLDVDDGTVTIGWTPGSEDEAGIVVVEFIDDVEGMLVVGSTSRPAGLDRTTVERVRERSCFVVRAENVVNTSAEDLAGTLLDVGWPGQSGSVCPP